MGLKDTLIRDVSEQEAKPLEKRYQRRKISRAEKAKEFEESFAEQTRKNLESMQDSRNRGSMIRRFRNLITLLTPASSHKMSIWHHLR